MKQKAIKKVGIAAFAAVSVLMFASCKKNYTCVCTYLDNTNTYRIDTTDMHSTKNTAKIDCNNKAKTLTQYGRTVVCEL